MYAVRSGNVDVYKCAQELLSKSTKIPKKDEEKINFKNLDKRGKSLLHFAAESACKEMLNIVIDKAKKLGVYNDMNVADRKGRVPMVYVLRSASPEGEGHIERKEDEKFKNRKAMLKLFLDELGDDGEFQRRALIDPQLMTKKNKSDEDNTREASIPALVHAARGGHTCFNLTRSVIFNLLKHPERPLEECWSYAAFQGNHSAEDDLGSLDSALRNSVESSEKHGWWGTLLSEAAKGGCVKILEIVMADIIGKVRKQCQGGWTSFPNTS